MKKIVAIASLILICSVSLFAQAQLQPLAVVKLDKTESITLAQVKDRVEVYQKQAGGRVFTPAQRREILDAMIDEKLVVQAAQKEGVTITNTMVNQYFLETLANQVGKPVTEAEFASLIQQQTNMSLDEFFTAQLGMNLAGYKNFLKNQLTVQQYIVSKKSAMLQSVAATDDEIRSFYDLNKASFVQSDILKLSILVVPKGQDASAAKKKAEELYKKVKDNKTTFEDLKKQMVKADSGFQVGDLLVPKNPQAAQQLGFDYNALMSLFKNKIGFLSQITETDSDYQFYTIKDRYDAKMLEISDVVQPDSNVTVYEYIKAQLTQQKQAEALSYAAKEVTEELRKPENFQYTKSETALESLLNW
ncbi:MAG: peptidyl-prolyl cis-trans isomerase [Spirochaetaceae bacterium]|nr:peptidyl-prolyl cis-trans isomerase [Spirochaetaceae bacterium]